MTNRKAIRRARRIRRTVLTVCLMALVAVISIGATVAYLTDKTTPVENVFTVGNINIDLDESPNLDLKMVPGDTITKDPKVTVLAGSEACYVFVKIEKNDTLETYIDYTVDKAWTPVPGLANVYYIDQAALTAEDAENAVYPVLDGNKVTVKNVEKDDMDALQATTSPRTAPKLTFTAYAIQSENLPEGTNVAQAYNMISK